MTAWLVKQLRDENAHLSEEELKEIRNTRPNKKELEKNEDLKKFLDQLKNELKPFVNPLTNDDSVIYKFLPDYRQYNQHYSEMASISIKLQQDSQILSGLYRLFCYLGIVESFGNATVELLVMLLIANGRDFHIESQHSTPRIRHACSMRDLEKEKVPLSTKLNFLRDNGLRIFTSSIDTDLRNSIAHTKFRLSDDKVYVKGKLFTDEKIAELTAEITRAMVLVDIVINDAIWKKEAL